MKQIKLFTVVILYIFFTNQSYSQGCYYDATFSHVNNGGGVVSFTNTSSMIGSSYWDFGDGNNSTQNNPTHTYTSDGTYTVTLYITYVWNMGVYGTLNCSDNTSTIIMINNSTGAYGCMNSSAANYNPSATIDDGSCIFSATLVTLQMNDSYGDGWNGNTWSAISTTGGASYGPFTISGSGYSGSQSFVLVDDCYDIICDFGMYQNEISWSLIDDNGTTLASGGSPYNSGLNTGTGSCPILGCMDTTATNYDPLANTDDGSCLWCPDYILTQVTPLGCPGTGNGALQVEIISGPTPSSISYVWKKRVYTGSMSDPYAPPYTTYILPFTGPIATGLYSGPSYKVEIQDNSGCSAVLPGGINVNSNLGGYWYQFVEIYGCTDTLASNYDSTANCDNSSCAYTVSGCTDPTAINYDPLAVVDDNSCIYSCGEITGVNLTDLIHDRVTVNWADMNNSSCAVDQIRIRYRELGTSSYSTKTMGGPLGNNTTCLTTSKRILNLSDSTKYEYSFKIWYQDGTIKDWHAQGGFTTLDACPNIANLVVTTPNPTRAKFTWDDSNGSYKFARINIRVDSISNPTSNNWFNAGGFGTYYGVFTNTKNGLIPGETYRARAKTWCDPAGGPYKAPSWTPLIFWTQPTTARIEGGIPTANLAIYPNPSRDMFNVSFKSEDIQNLEVRIVNVIGEVIYNEELQQFVGEYTKSIDLSAYTKGVYFLEITTNNGVVNKKIILQ